MLPMFPEFPECLIDKVQVCRAVGRVLNSGQGTQEGLGEFLNGWFEETVQSGFEVLAKQNAFLNSHEADLFGPQELLVLVRNLLGKA